MHTFLYSCKYSGSWLKSRLVITRVHHWWLDLYFVRKRKDKKRKRKSPLLPDVLTMYNIARWRSIMKKKKRGAVAFQFLHSDWDLFFLFCFLGSKHQQYKKHGYLLWQCHVSLIKKKWKIKMACVMSLCFLKTALHYRDGVIATFLNSMWFKYLLGCSEAN